MNKLTLALLFLSITIAGCKSMQKVPAIQDQPIPPVVTELKETNWKLTELMGKPVV